MHAAVCLDEAPDPVPSKDELYIDYEVVWVSGDAPPGTEITVNEPISKAVNSKEKAPADLITECDMTAPVVNRKDPKVTQRQRTRAE